MFAFLVVISVACLVFHYLNNFFRRNLVENLAGRHVLITGTDTGFGRKLALDLVRQEFVVHAGCYTQSGMEDLRKEASVGNRLRTFQLDVTNPDSVATAKKIIEAQLPPEQGLWCLVNNAGIVRGIVFEFASFDDYEATMDVNFYGIIRMTNAFLPLIQKAQGRIVNVVSIVGRFSLAAGPYSCSKFAAQAYSDGLRRHMASFGVKVSIIEPGFYPTNMTSTKCMEADIDRTWAALPDDIRRSFGEGYFTKLKDTFHKLSSAYPLASGNRVHHVTDSIRHAISSRYPKTRYVCGMDAALLYRPAATIVPDWIVDYGIALVKAFN